MSLRIDVRTTISIHCISTFDSLIITPAAYLSQYLLEKSRVVTRGTGELNYHIFYAIIAATDPARKQVRTCPCVFTSRTVIACLDRYTCMDGRMCRHACVLSWWG